MNNKNSMGSVIWAALAGFAAGAAAIILTDERKKQELKDKIELIKKDTVQKKKELQEEINKTKKKGKQKAVKVLEKAQSQLRE